VAQVKRFLVNVREERGVGCLGERQHRHIDGETAVTFLQEVKKALQAPGKL